MDRRIEHEALTHLENIEDELEAIGDRTSSWRAFLNGVLHGAGIIAGTLLGLAVLGWLLSIFGVVPGLDEFKSYVEELREEI